MMAEHSDGYLKDLKGLDPLRLDQDDEMFWEEVRKKKGRQRSESSSSVESIDIVKRSKTEESRSRKINANKTSRETFKVVVVFDQHGGPDLHPIHVTKAIVKEIGKINHARFMGNGRLLIFAASEEQRTQVLNKEKSRLRHIYQVQQQKQEE